eukprot:3376357-Pyramimonas_sp.AAC.1
MVRVQHHAPVRCARMLLGSPTRANRILLARAVHVYPLPTHILELAMKVTIHHQYRGTSSWKLRENLTDPVY